MLLPTSRVLCLLLLGLVVATPRAADEQASTCPVNADGVASQIKDVLGPRYAAAKNNDALKVSFRELEILQLQTGHCSVNARAHDVVVADRNRNIMEWHSINLWLGRLVSIVGRSSRGDQKANWRDEYSLFAEVYEFEP